MDPIPNFNPKNKFKIFNIKDEEDNLEYKITLSEHLADNREL